MIKITGANPAPGEKLVSTNTDIEFTILDDGSGIDISSLIVYFSGYKVISNQTFLSPFTGLITPNGSDYSILINPSIDLDLGKVYEVKIQVKNSTPKSRYFNYNYSFKTIPQEPILVNSIPKNGDILKVAQILKLEFDDIIDGIKEDSIFISINDLTYFENGVPDLDYNGGFSNIVIDGTSAVVSIDPKEALKNGDYVLKYKVGDNLPSPHLLSGSIEFSVQKKEEVLPIIFPQIDFLGFFQGIKRVTNVGTGKSLLVEWNKPIKRSYQNQAYVLVYQNEKRLNVFDAPTFIADNDILEAKIDDLVTAKTLSYGARALELPVGILDPNGMEVAASNFYKIPNSVELVSVVTPTSLSVAVSSTLGYPDAGLLFLEKEVIRYESVNRVTNTFAIPVNGRGLINTIPGSYIPGDTAKLFLNCTDQNTVILMGTPNYADDEESNRYLKGEGVVVTDYSDNDRQVFDRFDYCGWRSARPQDTIYGKNDCGTYLGGEYNGFRGFNVYDRMLAQEEMLIEATGEPVILLKRIWDGITCSCSNNRKQSPKVKSCQDCYGTGYEGGYIQYEYPRRADHRILVSFKETQEDLTNGEKEGLQQAFEPGAWTLAQPTIKDRDLLVRFDFTNDVEFIYEVLNVSRSKNFKRKFGRQELSLKRLDKTDIVYTYLKNDKLSDVNKPS